MIERLDIENYGCIRKASIGLTPLHAFIGPNDSGKSTILHAVQLIGTSLVNPDTARAAELALQKSAERGMSAVTAFSADGYMRRQTGAQPIIEMAFGTPSAKVTPLTHGSYNARHLASVPSHRSIAHALAGAHLVRFEPDKLRSPTRLLSDFEPVGFFDEKGEGLAAVYDALVNRDVQSFLKITEAVKKLFPHVKSVRLKNPDHQTKAMAIELANGEEISAELMSEGLLYYLAFAVLPYIQPSAVILVEEPENGLHPARIAEVMDTLRETSKATQILIATHSPLVVNEMKPEEVSVVTRTVAAGTKVTRLSDTPNFADRAKVYAPGELWISYANGSDEAPLLDGTARP